MTEQEREQGRRETVAAVPHLEHQAEAAQRALDGVQEKLKKYKELIKTIEDQEKEAKKALAAAQSELSNARKAAEKVLEDGPVTLSSGVTYAQAGVASATGGVN